jgi:UDP-N-acetylmuramate--alanine ligase
MTVLDGAHLIGIGGAGMSGIARILLDRGVPVSGSDARDSPTVLALRARGARIGIGQSAANLDLLPGGPAAVVVSSAIRDDNPELAAARARGITVLHRSAALAQLMTGHRVVCVAGTHGKTSTTSMLTVALRQCGLDPSFAIGGDLTESGANAHHGTGGLFVAEADESDGSFLAFTPSVTIVTNVEADHLDHHGTLAAYTKVFDDFVGRIAPGGTLVACADDPGSAALADCAAATGVRVRRYGFTATGPDAAVLRDFQALGGTSDERAGSGEVTVTLDGRDIVLRVSVPGRHMALNAAGALLAGLAVDAPLAGLLAGFAGFGGVRRRFEFTGRSGKVRVYDDYAHNPTKVAAQLAATRLVLGEGGRLVVVFQPHLYSRTRDFAAEFGRSLALADEVVVLDVYGAREAPIPGVTGRLVADAVDLPGHVHYAPGFDSVPDLVAGLVSDGDLVLTMGAGDVTTLGPEILAALDRRLG